jgi:2-dehydropantoate 2-reductase
MPKDRILVDKQREENDMRICVIGAGAMGSAIGGLLSEAGADVVLVDSRKEQVDALNSRGLKLDDGASVRTIKVRATSDPKSIGEVDLVVVLVKSYHTEQAVKRAQSVIGGATSVLSLQNGLGNVDTLIEILGPDRVLGGVTHSGSVLIAPGEVHFSGMEKKTFIGEMNGKMTPRVDQIVRLFNSAGLKTEATSNILDVIWNKLLVNVAVSALSAVTRLPHGGMEQVPEVKQCAFEAVSEAIRVAKACGIHLSTENPEQVWATATQGLSPEHKTSMLKDIESKAPTEIGTIAGAVVQYGKKHGIATPVNSTLVACVRGIEFQQKG